MAAINVTQETHAEIRMFAYGLVAEGTVTNIGDVGNHLWDFVRTKHADEFEAFVRESIAKR